LASSEEEARIGEERKMSAGYSCRLQEHGIACEASEEKHVSMLVAWQLASNTFFTTLNLLEKEERTVRWRWRIFLSLCVVVEEGGRGVVIVLCISTWAGSFMAGGAAATQDSEEDLRVYMRVYLFPLSLETSS